MPSVLSWPGSKAQLYRQLETHIRWSSGGRTRAQETKLKKRKHFSCGRLERNTRTVQEGLSWKETEAAPTLQSGCSGLSSGYISRGPSLNRDNGPGGLVLKVGHWVRHCHQKWAVVWASQGRCEQSDRGNNALLKSLGYSHHKPSA